MLPEKQNNNVNQQETLQQQDANQNSYLSSSDSDNTVVRGELIKHDMSAAQVTDDEYHELGDDEESEYEDEEESGFTTTEIKEVVKIMRKTPVKQVSQPTAIVVASNSRETVAVSSSPLSQIIGPHPEALDVAPVKAGQKLAQIKLSHKINRTKKLKTMLDKEIKKRKKLLKLAVQGQEAANTSKNDQQDKSSTSVVKSTPLNQIMLSKVTNVQPPQFSRIPKVLPMDPNIIKMAMDQVASRRKLSKSMASLSEILLVKQILAKGNPFKIIPQHCYDISKVPGIRLPHIQLLLRQWEVYFSNLLFDVVQVEYAIEYGNVQKRISTIVTNKEKFKTLFDFQELVDEDEVSVSNFITTKKDEKEVIGPATKKPKVDQQQGTSGAAKGTEKVAKTTSKYTRTLIHEQQFDQF